MNDTNPGKPVNSVKNDMKQEAAARKKSYPSKHPIKISGKSFTGKCKA